VNDAFLVCRVERLGDLASRRQCLLQRQHTLGELIGQCRPLHQLKDQCAHTIGLFDAVDRRDVLMIE
jgi:hypothetical protein